MAIDLSKYLGGTTGTWDWYGMKLPDYGITETQNFLPQNPLIPYATTPQPQPQTSSTSTTVIPKTTTTTQQPESPWTTQAQGDSPLRALEKIGWDNMNPSQRSEYLAMLGQQQQPSGPSQADLDAIYQPGMNTLNQQEQNFRAEQPLAEQKVSTSYGEGLSLLDKNLSEQEAQLNKQGTAIGTAKQNALAQARQLYSELQQRYGAQFGSRSSAGPAAQELLGRETSRQFGNIESQSGQAQQDVEGERTRLTSWLGDQKNTLLQKKNDALGEIQRTFTTGLAQIQAQRGQLESAKAAARVDLLNQARAQTQQVEAATTQFNRQIQMFQTQQEAQLQQMAYAKQLQGYNPAPFTPSQIGGSGTQSTSYNFAPTSQQKPGQIWDQNRNAWVYPGQ